jgi:hypothetical protein
LNVNEEIDKLLNDFTEQYAKDLEIEMFKALKKGGRGNPNPPDIEFKGGVVYGAGKVYLNVYSNKDYWYYIQNGRKKGKMPPPSVFDKEYMAKNNIKVQDIMLDITKAKKKPTYLKAVKQFAWIMARSIGRNGIKPKPFRDRVIEDGRLDKLETDIAKIIGKDITLQLTGI